MLLLLLSFLGHILNFNACRGNLLATRAGDLCYLDFGMMSEAPENARYAIIAHVVHLVNRDYEVTQPSPSFFMSGEA
jgi:hypothetical protein